MNVNVCMFGVCAQIYDDLCSSFVLPSIVMLLICFFSLFGCWVVVVFCSFLLEIFEYTWAFGAYGLTHMRAYSFGDTYVYCSETCNRFHNHFYFLNRKLTDQNYSKIFEHKHFLPSHESCYK